MDELWEMEDGGWSKRTLQHTCAYMLSIFLPLSVCSLACVYVCMRVLAPPCLRVRMYTCPYTPFSSLPFSSIPLILVLILILVSTSSSPSLPSTTLSLSVRENREIVRENMAEEAREGQELRIARLTLLQGQKSSRCMRVRACVYGGAHVYVCTHTRVSMEWSKRYGAQSSWCTHARVHACAHVCACARARMCMRLDA